MQLDSSWCIHKRWNWCHPRHLQSNEPLTAAADAGPKVMPWPALNSNNSQSPKGIPGKGTPMVREASAAKGSSRAQPEGALPEEHLVSQLWRALLRRHWGDLVPFLPLWRKKSVASQHVVDLRPRRKKGKNWKSPEVWSWPCGARQLGARASPPRARGGAPFLMRYVSW